MSEELAGDVAAEAAADFSVGFAFGSFPVAVGAGGGVGAESAEHDGVDVAVELSVAGGVESVPVGEPG